VPDPSRYTIQKLSAFALAGTPNTEPSLIILRSKNFDIVIDE
jgi:hypothetical protein